MAFTVSSSDSKPTYHRLLKSAHKEYTKRYHRGDHEILIRRDEDGSVVKSYQAKVVSPAKKNPTHKFTTRKAAKAYQRVVGGKRRVGSRTVRTNPASIKVHPGRLVEGRKKAQALADKTGQPVSLLQQFFKPSGKMVWTTYDTVYPSKPPTLPNNGRFVPAIVKVKGKAYNVEARRNPTTGRVQIRTNPATARKINPSSAVGQDAFDAGKRWRTSGAYSDSGVANARVVRYGFLKWYNGHSPSVLKGQKKSELEKGFREGYAAGKRAER